MFHRRYFTNLIEKCSTRSSSISKKTENKRVKQATKQLSTQPNPHLLQIPAGPLDNHDKLFDDFLFKLGLSLSVLIFLFLLEAHHYTPLMSSRQLYITYLTTAICLDLIDNIYFLDLLWQAVVSRDDLLLERKRERERERERER